MLLAKKPNYRRTLDRVMQFSSAIGEHTTISGQFRGAENIMVRGTVKGDSDVQGVIVITGSGCWQGHLVADVIVVAGRVEGDVEAREKLEIVSGGHIVGDIKAPVIAIETGAIHEGSVHMQEKAQVCQFEEKRDDALRMAN